MHKYFVLFLVIFFGLGIYFVAFNWSKNNIIAPKTVPKPTPATLGPNQFSVWIAWWDENPGLDSLQRHFDKINTVMPVWYSLDTTGKVIPISDVQKKSEITQLSKEKNIRIIPSIGNNFNPEPVSILLDHPKLQTAVITDLISIALENGYSGWDLDWENIYVGDRQGFTDFVQNLSEQLHSNNLILSVTVQAKTKNGNNDPTSESQDWKQLSNYADEIRIMAYDYHYSGSAPGAITPPDLYSETLQIALENIAADKIDVGLPTYGYDWGTGQGEALQYTEAVDRLLLLKINPSRDDFSQELKAEYFTGSVKHQLWFNDATSIQTYIEIARGFGLNKFSFWRLGGEDPRIWDLSGLTRANINP